MKKQEVIDNLKKLALQHKNKKYLTGEDIKKIPKLSYYIFVHFRTLGNALRVAGLPSSKLAAAMSISNEDLLSYLKNLQSKLRHSPTVWDIQHDNELYKKYSNEKITWSLYKYNNSDEAYICKLTEDLRAEVIPSRLEWQGYKINRNGSKAIELEKYKFQK